MFSQVWKMKCVFGRRTNFGVGFMAGVILIGAILAVLLLSLVPPTTKDELVHHLAVPKLYLEHGWIYEIPSMEYSYYPMNLELLYAIPLHFGNDIVPKFIHFTFALLTAGLIYSYIRRRTSLLYALFGAIFFISIPIIVKLSTTAYIDLGEIFFSFAALLLIMEWMKKDFKFKYLIYSGIACGLALGTKYNGLVTLAILTLFVPFIYSRYSNKKTQSIIRPIYYGAVFVFVSLLFFSPWMIRDYRWKGNPIYPLYNQIFNPPKQVQTKAPSEAVQNNGPIGIFAYRALIYKETGWQIAALPLRVFFQGKDGEPQYFDGRLNPILLLLSLFAFYKSGEDSEYQKREKKVLLVFSVLFFSIAFFTSVFRVRYLSPIIPPLIILSVFGLQNLFMIASQFKVQKIRRLSLSIVFLIPCFALILNAGYIWGQFKIIDPIPFITGNVSRDEYIAQRIPEYRVEKYINNNLNDKSKVLFILIGNRGYYCDREYTHDMGILQRSIGKAGKVEDILENLRKNGITHLLINYNLFERWMHDNFPEEKQVLTQAFFKEHMELLYGENGFGVSVLK
jgi:4-amino-4-deoxy-L-arabinose transferase-like glycosyltransferase